MIRRLLAVVILAAMIVPLALPYLNALTKPAAWRVWWEADRIAELMASSVTLALATCLIAVPVGVVFSLSYLTWSHGVVGLFFAVGLATPLPVLTISGTLIGASGGSAWNPFLTGLPAAIFVHAWASVPWVVWIVGPALLAEDRALADEERLQISPLNQCWHIVRSANRAILLATIWVIVQTTGEIVVTDMARVRTLAEEAYTQFVAPSIADGPSPDLALTRAVIATLPIPICLASLLYMFGRREWTEEKFAWQRRPGSTSLVAKSFGFVAVVLAAGWLALSVAPLWMRTNTFVGLPTLWAAARNNWQLMTGSLLGSLAVGVVVATLSLIACLAARRHAILRGPLALLAIVSLTVPGPVLGFGVHQAIDSLIDFEHRQFHGCRWMRAALFDGPSLLPVWWAQAIRAWPLAAIVLWPVVRALPRGFRDITQLESGSTIATWRNDLLPSLGRTIMAAVLLVAAICCGEVSASKIVATPDGETFAHDLFSRMHYGISPDLAAMAIVFLVGSMILTLPLAWALQTRTEG